MCSANVGLFLKCGGFPNKVKTLYIQYDDLVVGAKGTNFRPDSTESNMEHGQGLGGSSLVRSTVIS